MKRKISNSPFLSSYFPTIKNVVFSLFTGLLLLNGFGLQAQTQEPVSRVVPVNLSDLVTQLADVPMEGTAKASTKPVVVSLPMPDGDERSFNVVRTNLMAPDFAAQYPSFRTYKLLTPGDPSVRGRATVTPYGLMATIFTPQGLIEIFPENLMAPVLHKVSIEDFFTGEGFSCGFEKKHGQGEVLGLEKAAFTNGSMTRTYSYAIVTTGEYGQTHGGTVASATAVVVAQVNAAEDIYEKELAVKFTLLTPLIFLDPNTDPFPSGNSNRTLMAAEAISANWPVTAYDIGHCLHSSGGGGTWGGGVAFFGLCNDGIVPGGNGTGRFKGGAWSSVGDTPAGALKLFAHEMGHQFYMPHTFNGSGSSCQSNIDDTHSFEIASGNTIMSYNGICGAGQNIPDGGVADHYFYNTSLEAAINRMNDSDCETETPSGNAPPTVNANPCGGGTTIPKGTPFRLTGSGTDADGDIIYYSWEQRDEDGAGTPTQGFIGATAAGSNIAPLFRAYPPNTSPSRTFPNMTLVAANQYASDFEPLPSVARTLNFQLTGRDLKTVGGGVNSAVLTLTVSNSGPFAITAPNGGGTIAAGSNTTVTWNVNGTNTFCNNVNIKLSIDGGLTFPYTLLSNTPNDGSQSVTLPVGVANTTQGRMMVECADNDCIVFFDISNTNFTITSDCNAATSIICPTTPLSLPVGDPGLNMGLSQHFGGVAIQNTFNISAASPTGPLANATTQGGSTCQTAWGTERYGTFDFTVETTGSYTFTNISGGETIFSIFVSNGYNPAAPCAGTFLGSNAWDAIAWSDVATVTLTACTKYKLVLWTLFGANGTPTITFSGAGTVYSSGAGPGANYSYTYAAVNTANSQVVAVSATSNFTSLAAGSYLVYGASYYSGAGPNPPTVNPATWVGQTISQILSGGSCTLFSSNSRSVTVTGGGGTPSLSIAATDANKAEGNAGSTAFTFTVTRTGNTANQSTASWAVTGSGGSPANGADFTGGNFPSGTVTFPAGSSASQTITVNVNGDTDVEPNEGFTVTLSNPTNATIGTATATGTIQNDDSAGVPSIAISGSPSLNEGNAGPTAFTFTVIRTGSTTNQSTASWAVTGSGGNPANGADFTGGNFPSGTVTFPAGSSANQTITVNVNGDTDVEPNEGFTVTLSNPTNATITTATANGTIQNDDSAGGCPGAYCAVSQTTGGCGTPPDEFISNVTFNTINNNSTCAQSLPAGYTDYTTISTSVMIGSMYALNVTNGTTAYPEDQCRAWFDWNADGDFTDAGEEFVLTGSGTNNVQFWTVNVTVPGGATIGSTRMRVRITYDAAPLPCGNQQYSEAEDYCITISSGTPSIAISGSPSLNEGNAGSTAFTFTVVRTGSTANQSTASWAVTGSGGSPANGADFTGGNFPSDTVTFPAGSSANQTITVNVNGDTDVEPNEGFTVTLSNPTNATITTATASGTIQNDDVAVPTIAISGSPTLNEGNAGPTAFTFTVARTGSTTNQSTASWAVTGSGANPANGADFTGGNFPSGTVTFPAGSSANQTITVNVNGDTDVEPNEFFTVTLSNPTNATITTATAPGIILNDDTAGGGCQGTYCAASQTSGTCSAPDEFISNVTFNTINNSSTCAQSLPAGYTDYTSISTSVNKNVSYALNVTNGGPFTGDQCKAWFDWNQDGDFDDAGEEFVLTGSGTNNAANWTVNVTIPSGATSGSTRMRVRITYIAAPTSCGSQQYSETEDYCITVTDDCSGSYCAASQTTGTCANGDEFISNVTFNTIINNTSTCAQSLPAGYTDYTSISTSVNKNASYPLNVTNGGPFNGDQCKAWFDWNQDDDFDDAGEEFVLTGSGTNNAQFWTVNVTVPSGASLGSTRMRVRVFYTGSTPACGAVGYGEAEDYCITVSGSNCPTTLTVPGTIASGTYQAADHLYSDGTIPNAANVIFRAGSSITLDPNFEVQLGGILTTEMGGCNPVAPPVVEDK